MNVLEMNHVKKHFGGLEVLKDINLSVSEGQVVSIIGPSGSGKSTLLRCATLLETMDNGDLIYLGNYAAKNSENGSVYASADELKKIKSNFGLVFQNFNLFPHHSVIKNITEAPILVQKDVYKRQDYDTFIRNIKHIPRYQSEKSACKASIQNNGSLYNKRFDSRNIYPCNT